MQLFKLVLHQICDKKTQKKYWGTTQLDQAPKKPVEWLRAEFNSIMKNLIVALFFFTFAHGSQEIILQKPGKSPLPSSEYLNDFIPNSDLQHIILGYLNSWEETWYIHRGSYKAISSLAFSPNSNSIACADDDYTYLWNHHKNEIQSFAHIKGLRRPSDPYQLVFSPNGKYVAVDQTQIWKIQDNTFKVAHVFENGSFASLPSFSIDGDLAYKCDDYNYAEHRYNSQKILIWKIANDKFELQQQIDNIPPDDVILNLFFTKNDLLILTFRNNTLKLWQFKNKHLTLCQSFEGVRQFGWHGCFFSQNGKYLATAMQKGTIQIWQRQDSQDFELLQEIEAGEHIIAFSPNNKIFASALGGSSEIVKIWENNKNQFQVIQYLKIPADKSWGRPAVCSIAFCFSGKYLAIGGQGDIRVYANQINELLTN